MNYTFRLLIAVFCIASASAQQTSPNIQVFFSPGGGCAQAIINSINSATGSILVEAYSFTAHDIARALVAAKQRGIDVRIILDGSNLTDKHSDLQLVAQSGIPTYIDKTFKIAHDKVMIFDGSVVTTGSYNFSWDAETQNAENLVRITDPATAQTYTKRWAELFQVSSRYQP